jgi:hypothetical protein
MWLILPINYMSRLFLFFCRFCLNREFMLHDIGHLILTTMLIPIIVVECILRSVLVANLDVRRAHNAVLKVDDAILRTRGRRDPAGIHLPAALHRRHHVGIVQVVVVAGL